MIARVYLLADFGGSQANKGPREVACHPLKSGRRVLGWESYSPETRAHIIGAAQRQSCAGAPLRAWWLVEAESADAARRTIEAWSAMAHDPVWPSGRILASGGARK